MSAADAWPSFAGMWCGVEGPWTDETARAHFDACEDCQTERAAFVEAQQVEHAGWCTKHITDPDGAPICQHSVTFGDFTVDLEDSPAWPDDERWQVVPPNVPDSWVSAADARQLAAALIEAARIIEDAS